MHQKQKQKPLTLYLYLCDTCNLNCKHCFLQASPHKKQFISWNQIVQALQYYRQKNYSILKLTGGEASLSPFIKKTVLYAKQIGYTRVEISSNGTTPAILSLIDYFKPQQVNKFVFSLDGATSEINDYIRGQGSFKKTIYAIKKAIKKQFQVEIVFTVNQKNIHQVKKLVYFLDNLKVNRISFNCISNMGNAKQHPNILITPQQWVEARHKIEQIGQPKHTSLRYPLMFVTPQEYKQLLQKDYHCLIKDYDKVEIRPNGNIFNCCLLGDQPQLKSGKIFENKVVFDKSNIKNFLL
ncbi:hypothetical protein DRH14_02920 [Candidatus Shapirobacteria bacterium]|nr:MAG: hypothetical protein DRH14_02920 [Candidatus Shapirobacteria bacterium]